MKKLSKLLAIATSFATLFFAACSDVDTAGSVAQGTNDTTNNSKEYSVSFAAADGTDIDFSTLVATSSNSKRSIVATDQDLSSYKYVLYGTNLVTGAAVKPQEVNFTADNNDSAKGTVILNLPVANYKLVLAAMEEADFNALGDIEDATSDDIKLAALYVGYANVDLRNTNTIKFYISSDGLTGEGGIALTIVYDGLAEGQTGATTPYGTWTKDHVDYVKETSNYTIAAYIETRTDGSLVYPTGETNPTNNITNADFFGGTGGANKLTNDAIAPGTYNLVVLFTGYKNGNLSGKSYEYSDTIIVLPNQTVTATVKVPDVVEYAPAAPTDLHVGYVSPETDDIGTYTAVLKWTDNSKNESYFQVEVYDVSSKVDSTSGILMVTTSVPDTSDDTTTTEVTESPDTAFDSYTRGITSSYYSIYEKTFYGNSTDGWVAGSLQKNNNHLAIKLSLGVPYLIRIAAVNDAGTSDYAYAYYDLDETWQDTDTYHAATYVAKPFAVKTLNYTTSGEPAVTSFSATSTSDIYVADDDDEPTCAYTANLYRLTYHLNGGTLTYASGTNKSTADDLVYYLSVEPTNGVDILAPYYPVVTANQVYPTLISSGNRWTAWTKSIVEGTKYDSTATTVDGFTYYAPAVYKGFKNLDLFASYVVSSATVEAYLDSNYNFVDGEVTLDTASNVIKKSDHAYTVYTASNITGITAATSITVKYTFNADPNGTAENDTDNRKAFTYSSLFATITRNGRTYAKQDLSSNSVTLSVINLPADGAVYQLTVIGEYKGHQYSYPITLTLQDAESGS